MEMMIQLANVSLKDLLSSCLKDCVGLQLTWVWEEKILRGQDHELYYVDILTSDTHLDLLKQFVQEWKPIYEKLSLHHDYFVLRSEITAKNSYNIIEQLEELLNDVHKPRVELWMDSTSRSRLIGALDESIFQDSNVSKGHLYYLANNTYSTAELYSLIEQTMTQNILYQTSASEQTQLSMKTSFTIIHQAIHQYNTKQQIELLCGLTDKLEDFYIWLKGVLTAIQNYIHNGTRKG